jgi:hypothetical protein
LRGKGVKGKDHNDDDWADGGSHEFLDVIEEICDRYKKTKKSSAADVYTARWNEEVSEDVNEMFSRWCYVSEGALEEEMKVFKMREDLREGLRAESERNNN